MGEPTETVVMEGGLLGGLFRHLTPGSLRIALPASESVEAENGDIVFAVAYYADTGRRTADGRRVFAVEG